jgi:hypothetical protein
MYNKITALLASAITLAHAQTDSDCFTPSKTVLGFQGADPDMSNEDKLAERMTPDMKLRELAACVDPGVGRIVSLTFTLVSSDGANTLELDGVGLKQRDLPAQATCSSLILGDDEVVSQMRVTYTSNYVEAVVATSSSGTAAIWGASSPDADDKTWSFNGEHELIGNYGEESDASIMQLGVIVYDGEACRTEGGSDPPADDETAEPDDTT